MHPAGAVLDERRGASAARCPHAGDPPRRSRQPGRGETAAKSGPSGAAPGRCLQRGGSPTRWTARRSRRVSPARRGSGGAPTADSPWPGERQGVQCPGSSAGGRACAACSCSYFFAASLRCQARSVAGVTGKTSVQPLRGMSRASAVNHTRSVGSYGSGQVAAQHRVLMPEHEQLSILLLVATAPQGGQAEHPTRQHIGDLEQHSASQAPPRPARSHSAGQLPNRVFERHKLPPLLTLIFRCDKFGIFRRVNMRIPKSSGWPGS